MTSSFMFWQSIIQGFIVLKTPGVMTLLLFAVLFYMAYLFLIRLATDQKESADAAGPGCLTQVLAIFFQGFLMGILILLLTPVLLGISHEISWPGIEPFVLIALRAGLIASLLLVALSFLPYVGRFLAASPALEVFLSGVLIFRLISPPYIAKTLPISLGKTSNYPRVWQILIYLVLTILFSKSLSLLVTMLQIKIKSMPRACNFLRSILGPSLDILAGFFTLFMYVTYVRLFLGLS
jgi:hypothetical protein